MPDETPKARLLRPANLLDAFAADAAERYDAKQSARPMGPVSGLPLLDRELSGALMPGLHIMHGSPGTGKTAFALQMGATCGCPCLYVTCEMSPIELLRRITARVTGTYLGRFKTGELAPDVAIAHARRAVQAVPLLIFADATTAAAPPDLLLEAAESLREQNPETPHFLIIIDSVHSWVRTSPATRTATEYDALNTGLDSLRQLSQMLRCPILGIAERNRGAMKEGGQSASAGSRVFEYASETVLELETKKDETPDLDGEVKVTLTLSKNRHGSQGKKIGLKFHGAKQSFREDH